MKFADASDRSLLVIFGDDISPELNREVVALFRALESAAPDFIHDLHPAYASLLIDFDPLRIGRSELRSYIQCIQHETGCATVAGSRTVEIPVCYGGTFGPDLAAVAHHCGLSEDEVICTHADADYTVYFLGFAPGFAYMGGLPSKIANPRLESPRKLVPAGSVGIAGSQTGVYSIDSPGGWRLIGRTPRLLFNPNAACPALLQPGDRVRFVAITPHVYEEMARL